MLTMLQVFEGYWHTIGSDDSVLWSSTGPFTPAPSPHQQIVDAVNEYLDVTAGFKRCLYTRLAPNYTLVNQIGKFAAHYAGIQGNQIYTTAEQLDQIPLANMTEDQARSAAWSLRESARVARNQLGE